MSIKELFKLVLNARKHPGAILITRGPYYAECTLYGDCNNSDIDNYTKGFDTSN